MLKTLFLYLEHFKIDFRENKPKGLCIFFGIRKNAVKTFLKKLSLGSIYQSNIYVNKTLKDQFKAKNLTFLIMIIVAPS